MHISESGEPETKMFGIVLNPYPRVWYLQKYHTLGYGRNQQNPYPGYGRKTLPYRVSATRYPQGTDFQGTRSSTSTYPQGTDFPGTLFQKIPYLRVRISSVPYFKKTHTRGYDFLWYPKSQKFRTLGYGFSGYPKVGLPYPRYT